MKLKYFFAIIFILTALSYYIGYKIGILEGENACIKSRVQSIYTKLQDTINKHALIDRFLTTAYKRKKKKRGKK